MISSTTNSLLSYLTASSAGTGADGNSAALTGALAKAKGSATARASLRSASETQQAATAGRALDRQQAILASDLRSAMGKAGVNLAGAIEFSVGSDGSVATKGSDADKAAMTAFLKADTSKPSFASRIATQAQDAIKVSGSIQQHAAISQAARYAAGPSGVMSLYSSLMSQADATVAVFTLSASGSSLSYPGSLSAKA